MTNSIKTLLNVIAHVFVTWFILMTAVWLVCIFFGAPLNFHTWHPLGIGIIGVSTFIGAVCFLAEYRD